MKKLLISADIHGNHEAFQWLVQSANRLSVPLVLAGDLLGCPDGFDTTEEAQEADAAQMFTELEEVSRDVYYLWGNDDFVEIPSPTQRIHFLHGSRFELGSWNILGYQHSPPFVGGPHEREDSHIASDLAQLEALADSRTILVTHSPAYGVLDLGILDVHAGSPAILDFVRRTGVHAHVHGHIHDSFGVEGKHFNAAAAGECRGLLLDVEGLEATVLRGPDIAV